MPVDWRFAEDIVRLGGVDAHKIAPDDGARQQETARSILGDFEKQPGVILADEVGMGKTYVALAVVASVVRATRNSGKPVVVMVPPGLARKWPREWEQFKALCCARPDALAWVRDVRVHTPTDFFKALDDPRASRAHIIWMTTKCFERGLSDPWTKLALVRLARSNTKMDDETKKKICKWATTLVRLKGKRGLTPEIVERLLLAHLSQWRRILVREDILTEEDDEPVPQHLLQHQHEVDWSPLVAVLRGESIPGVAAWRPEDDSKTHDRTSTRHVSRSTGTGSPAYAGGRPFSCSTRRITPRMTTHDWQTSLGPRRPSASSPETSRFCRRSSTGCFSSRRRHSSSVTMSSSGSFGLLRPQNGAARRRPWALARSSSTLLTNWTSA